MVGAQAPDLPLLRSMSPPTPRPRRPGPGAVGAAWVLLLTATAFAGELGVVWTSPAAHVVGAPAGGPVRVGFDAPLDVSSLAGAVIVNGRWSGPVPGTLKLLDGDTTLTFVPDRPFFAGEEVFVQLTDGVRGRDGETLPGGHGFSFWARAVPASATDFTLVGGLATSLPGEGTVQSYGLHAGDRDGDGSPDFTIPNEVADDVRVLLNDGCGQYGPLALNPLGANTTPSANESRDLDGDGVLDFATANIGGNSVSLLFGDGSGALTAPLSLPAGVIPRGLAMLDADGDGDIDIVSAHLGSSDLGLFRNDGAGNFAAMQAFDGGFSGEQSVAAADADGDGDADLFVGHFFSSRVSLLLNDGTGVFTLSAHQLVGSRPWNLAVGDIDGDGAVDVITCSSDVDTVSVVRGNGAGALATPVDWTVGGWPIAVDLGDLDGDGDLDLVVSNHDGGDWTVRLNDGAGGFATTYDLPALSAGSCATLVDDDRDGRLDIVGVDEVADAIMIWRHAPPPPGLQVPTCHARLAVDGAANLAGFSGAPPHPLVPGGKLYLGVSSKPGRAWGLMLGFPAATGLPTSAGKLHLLPNFQFVAFGTTDLHGESLLVTNVPATLTPGDEAAMQVLVQTPAGLRLGNAEILRVAD